MSKMKEKEETEISDRDLQDTVGGVTVRQFDTAAKNCDSIDEKLAKFRGDKATTLLAFEEAGGNKSSFKAAIKVSAMETGNGRDWYRTFIAYLAHLGFFNQLDMFEKQELGIIDANLTIQADGKEAKIAATLPKSGGPKSIGSAQAEAFHAAH